MKKLLKLGLVSVILSSGLFASDWRGGMEISGGNFGFQNSSGGADVGVKVSVEKEIIKHAYIGGFVGVDFFDPNVKLYNQGETADIGVSLSYDLIKPLNINVGYAYTAGIVDGKSKSEGFDGTTYSVGLRYMMTSKVGLTASYRNSSVDLIYAGEEATIERFNGGLFFKF